jgi:hypothetical protein
VANATQLPNIKTHGWSPFKTDMFGRTKVSDPFTIFDSQHRYAVSDDFSIEVSGGGTSSYNADKSTQLLTVGTASGDRCTAESRRVMPYQPGKSLQVLQSFVFAPAKAGLRQRVGYFSRQNGVFLEQVGTETFIVLRSFVTGSVVENRIAQKDWNVEPLNGTGDTDLLLDLSKAQIFWSEYEWLGVGAVRCGFVINGAFVTAHQFNHSNEISTVYMTTAALPLRYEIENISAVASSSSLSQVCASVSSNGGYDRRAEKQTAFRNSVNVGTTLIPLIAIRLTAGKTDSVVIPGDLSVVPLSQGNYEYQLVKNPTSLTGESWSSDLGKGNVEYNVGATAVSGGVIVDRGVFVSTNQASGSAIKLEDRFALQLGRTNAATPVSDVLVLCVRTLSSNGSVASTLSWFNLI